MKTTDRTTKRDFYEAIIKAMETGETNIEPAKIIEFCENEIALLDKKADKAKERAAAKKAEVDELMEKVYAVLSDTEFMTRNAVMDALGDMPDTPHFRNSDKPHRAIDCNATNRLSSHRKCHQN